jgi:hypothetical protein
MGDDRKEFEERIYLILETFAECPSFVNIPKDQQDEIVKQIMDCLDYFDLNGDFVGYPEGGYF